jgi:hypothetical protein
MINQLFTTTILVVCLSCSYLLNFEQFNLDVAVQRAKQENKNILLIFSVDSCEFCNILENDLKLFNLDNYVVCIFNATNNMEVAKSFGVILFPTSFIISVEKNKEKILSTHVGYSQNKYKQWIEENNAKSNK